MSPDRTTGLGIVTTSTERKIADHAVPTAKSWEMVERFVSFPENVSGLRTLDIGGGGSDITAHLLELGADAYAIDPKYKSRADLKGRVKKVLSNNRRQNGNDPDSREINLEAEAALERQIQSMKTRPERYITAYATQLPFPNDYFDLVFSISCIFSHLDENSDVLMQAVEEAIRVTKPGGRIQLAPFAFFEPDAETLEVSNLRAGNQVELVLWLQEQKNLKVTKRSQIRSAGLETLTITKNETAEQTPTA